jgi:hypothetical protein
MRYALPAVFSEHIQHKSASLTTYSINMPDQQSGWGGKGMHIKCIRIMPRPGI